MTCAQYKLALPCKDNGAPIVLVISGESQMNGEVPLRAGGRHQAERKGNFTDLVHLRSKWAGCGTGCLNEDIGPSWSQIKLEPCVSSPML